jgi:hypothetical protein
MDDTARGGRLQAHTRKSLKGSSAGEARSTRGGARRDDGRTLNLRAQLEGLGAPRNILESAVVEEEPLEDEKVGFLWQAYKHLGRRRTDALSSKALRVAVEAYRDWTSPEGPLDDLRDCLEAQRELQTLQRRLNTIGRRHGLAALALQPLGTAVDATLAQLEIWIKKLGIYRAESYGRKRLRTAEQLRLVVRLRAARLSDKDVAALLMLLGIEPPADLDGATRRVNLLRRRNEK